MKLTAIGAALALCTAGAIAAILSGAPGVDADRLAPVEELPGGGFDPLPEFETTSGELEFRGVECGLGRGPRILVRQCPSETERE